MMAESCYVFPQTLDLAIGLINSPTLGSMTRVDDSNTCGIKIADVFNIVKVSQHKTTCLFKAVATALEHAVYMMDFLSLTLYFLSIYEDAAGNWSFEKYLMYEVVTEERFSVCHLFSEG